MGGLLGGIKLGRSKASLPVRVEVECLRPSQEFLDSLEQRLLLVYTGKTRLARNLLQVCSSAAPLYIRLDMMMMMMMVIIIVPCCRQDVVRSWYSRLPALVQNAHELVANSEDCTKAVLEGETLHHGPVSVLEVFY